MDNIKRTSLDEAKANYEQIKKFATEAAQKEFEKEINEKVDNILKEALSIEIDDENNMTVTKDDKVVELYNDGEVEDKDSHTDNEEYDDDNEEIEIEKNIEEMIEQEDPQAAPVAPAEEIPADDSIAPVEDVPADDSASTVSDDVLQLAQLLDKIIDNKISGGEGTEQGVDVDYIDDDAAEAPAPEAAPAPAPSAPAAPIQEDDLLEFSLDEIENLGEENMLEFELGDELGNDESDYYEIEDDFIEANSDKDAMFSAFDDISKEPNWKDNLDLSLANIPAVDEYELDEIKGIGKILRNTSNRLGLEPKQGTPNLQESKIKAQYESKLDELKKENRRLNESNKEFGEVIKNYQDSFKDLRKQFDEMQTFNAKLAYANKIFASGGLSTSDKARIAEEFDKTQNVDEAKKLYNKILQENKIIVSKDNASKIKSITTNTIQGKGVVYESNEMKRNKILSGIAKNENYL